MSSDKPKLYVEGMHGLGDNIHQRAILRKLVKRYDVWLETSWPTIYYDIPIHCVAYGTKLRTQLKNVEKEKHLFVERPAIIENRLKIWYDSADIRETGSVLGAMMKFVGLSMEDADFSFPVPEEWRNKARKLIQSWGTTKPILFYRPLVVRREWKNCNARNPNRLAYLTLINEIRSEFFVVSIADANLVDEKIVSHKIPADVSYHRGELDFPMLAALTAESSLVFASPGFVVPLARAIGTPVICVFGGYENSSSFSVGYSPYLGIDTVKPCSCYSRKHNCNKTINIPKAKQKMRSFLNALPSKDNAVPEADKLVGS